jgi:hypothetical protein
MPVRHETRQGATKRPETGMNGQGPVRDGVESLPVRSSFSAVRRMPLAPVRTGFYSALHRTTRMQNRGTAMSTITLRTQLAAALMACACTAGLMAGLTERMHMLALTQSPNVVVLDRVIVTPAAADTVTAASGTAAFN